MVLVVLQFTIAITLTIGALFVQLQTRHAATQQLGFDRENVLLLHGLGAEGAPARHEGLRDAMARLPGVKAAALAAWAPADMSVSTSTFRLPGQSQATTLRIEPVDFGYFETLGARLLAGRLFDPAHGADIMQSADDLQPHAGINIVVTRAMLSKLGVRDPEAALGMQLPRDAVAKDAPAQILTIVGVVEDMQILTARAAPDAALFVVDQKQQGVLLLRLAPGDQKATLAAIDKVWAEMRPGLSIRRSFLDENIDRLYETEARQAKVIALFAGSGRGHRLPGAVWPGQFHGGAADKGDWPPQGSGRAYGRYRGLAGLAVFPVPSFWPP